MQLVLRTAKTPATRTSTTIVILWVFVTAIHGLFIFHAAYVGAVYVLLPTHAPTLVSTTQLYGVAISTKYFDAVAGGYFSLAAVHGLLLLRIVYRSARSRRFMFMNHKTDGISTAPHRKLENRVTLVLHRLFRRVKVPRVSPLPAPSEASALHTISVRAVHSAKAIASATSVTDPNYGTVRALWEIVESAFLTAQVYKSSCRVSSQWMNTLQVVLLVLNCWCFTIVDHVGHASLERKRLLCLLVNICIDTTVCIVIPTLLFVPYWRRFDPSFGDFDLLFWYTDRCLSRVLNEFPMLFVTSLGDAISRILISVRIVRGLADISQLTAITENHATRDASEGSFSSNGPTLKQPRTPRLSRIERGLHIVLSIWGAVVLGLHIHAASMASNPGCLEQVRPWATRRAACSLAEISCARGTVSSRATEFDAALQDIDHKWLMYLIIRHCPAVEVTRTLQDLQNLVGFKMYNSTIDHWGPEAALTAQHHPHIRFVFFAATNMSAFPRGLYDAAFPSQLMDIEICRSNLSVLPDELGDVWPDELFLLLEETQLKTVPPVLRALRPYFLSLIGHNFSSIPAFVVENPMLLFLKVGRNPVSELPELPSNASNIAPSLVMLDMFDTNISDLPSWLNINEILLVEATNTPLCAKLLSFNASSHVDTETAALQRVVRCNGVDLPTHFPLALEPIINP
ncbi:hypothetical protein PINS_up000916 [Pythium insidiosum]|nr:hypothetical protein PINS_up000916 [Pythium insidiosum]